MPSLVLGAVTFGPRSWSVRAGGAPDTTGHGSDLVGQVEFGRSGRPADVESAIACTDVGPHGNRLAGMTTEVGLFRGAVRLGRGRTVLNCMRGSVHWRRRARRPSASWAPILCW